MVLLYRTEESFVNRHSLAIPLFPRATSQVAMLAWIFGDCREGQIPRCLQRCKFDTPLLAAGSLIQTIEL